MKEELYMSRMKQEKFGSTGRYKLMTWLVIALMFAVTGARAASVDKEKAATFAGNWLKSAGNALQTEIGNAAVGDVEEFKNADGAVLGYIVSLEPKGFMVVAADDRINPVVMVSKDGKFDGNYHNPLVAMLYADLTARMEAVEKLAPAAQTRGEIPEAIQQNKAQWDRFLNGKTRAAVIGVVSEVWVAPFVESRWSQKDGIYNYYTPTIYDKTYSFDEPGNQNNAPSGCVATGTAQILRYFQWPQKPIGVKTGHYSVTTNNGTEIGGQSMNLRGGDGTGGAYNWDAMTLVLTGNEKLENYKQIGALLFDAGLSVNMSYSSEASGSNYSPNSMRNFFGYGAAARSLNENDTRANLDARRPVGVSISSIIPEDLGGEGHAIVCDGYGRMDGRWYYHMNYGWAGGGDGWYNKEEVYGSTWSPSFGWAMGNLYRQKLQPNDDLGGQIISGRVTDANGNPVAGVKVSIRKKGSEDTWQTMLVWNEPNDPEATPIYQDWDEKGNNDGTQDDDEIPGADKFRNTTDARGIWAIDKVKAGQYEIVLEKDGLNFAGTKTVTVPNNRNVWANDFIASPLENLALQSWWIEDGVAYLQFNRAVGNVDVDLTKATIGGTALDSGEAQIIASSDIIAITGISATGDLALEAGFLTVDVDGSNTTDQALMYNVAPVVVLDAVEATAAGTAAESSKVTKITLKNDANTKDNLLVFQVTGNGLTDADLNSFKIRNITTGKVGTKVPNASIYSWTPSTGELVVRAYNGEAYIGVDYIPETGRAYLSSELYTFDDCGPAIIAAKLDKSNKFVTVTWNEPVLGWTAKVQATDLNVILHNNGGTITNAQVDKVELEDEDADGYATTMKVYIKYTPSLEVQTSAPAVTASGDLPYTALNNPNWDAEDDTIATYRAPAGVETIEVVPRENKVYDALKNAASTGNTTDALLLFANNTPRLVSAILSNDNYGVQLTFNKRIFGKSSMASPLMQIVAVNSGAANVSNFIGANDFTAVVNYNIGSTAQLQLDNNGIHYTIGTNFIYIDFNYNTGHAGNRRLLDPAYNEAQAEPKTPQSITLTLKNIVDRDGNALKDTNVTIPLWPAYQPGRTSLLPPMFTNRLDSYTYIEQPNNEVLVTKASGSTPNNYLYTPYGKGTSGVNPESDGLIYYGIYYRDTDGDGRIDAVDLNYHNPDYNGGSNPAQLYAGGSAASNFRVWVQNNDPDDIDDNEKAFYPAGSEGVNWDSFPTDAPLGNGTADNTIYNFRNQYGNYSNFAKNWVCLTPTSVEVIAQNQSKSGGSNDRYSTLRLHIDQSRVRARTYGTRFIMVSYSSPRDVTSYGGNGAANGKYNKYMTAGGKAPTNDTAPGIYSRYNDSDETAGVYWRRSYTGGRSDANGTNGYMDNVHIADGFGPVVAWDGAAPVPVTAIAWRATPYVKNGESDMNGYEYVDVTFTEPIAYAADKAMSGCGYTSDPKNGVKTIDGYIHGAWGAEVISADTVRFKVNGVRTSKSFTFNGALFGMTPGYIESYTSSGTRTPTGLNFTVNAVGVKPIDSRYKVVSQGTAVDMFTVDAADATITSYGTTFTQSVSTVELKSIEQGGDWRAATANWLRDGNSRGGVGTSLRDNTNNATTTMTYSIRSNSLSSSVAPGSSVYGVISQLVLRNNAFAGYAVRGGDAEVHCPAAEHTFYAPDPIGRNMAFVGPETPVKSVMSGPIYNMVKVSAITQTNGTSRIVAGRTVSVLGIDVAGAAAHKLTAVTVRAIDTSMGQFDPSIDLETLADGATSGLQLYDVANGAVVKVANNGDEWSEWKVNEAGQPYKEVTLRPLTPVTLPTAGGNANSHDFEIRVITSASFNLGDSFIIEIPDDGIAFGSYKTVDNRPATWGTPNGAPGFPFTDFAFRDTNNDARWAEGDSIASKEDSFLTIPLYDGGRPYLTASNNRTILSENGVNVKNLYYAKKNWATNPESSPFYGGANVTSNERQNYTSILGGIDFIGTNTDLSYNVSYTPGDDVWYDIGGELGVYDEGIDIPLFGNANAFPLSWQVAESGAKSGQYRAAATATAGPAGTGYISAPSEGPVATVGLDMRDAGRGFGPRFILDDSILVESISKNVAGGEYSIVLKNGKLIWNNGAEFDIPADNGRAVVDDGNGTFIVVRTLDSTLIPTADTTVNFTVNADPELDIQQPSTITGVRITALGRGNVANTKGTLTRNGTKLSWKGGAEVDVADGGFFFLNGGAEDYLVVQVSQVGGGTSDELAIYSADGRSITPFLNISGLEIMTVSDMVPQGYYTFSYDGAGTLSWGNGTPANVNVAEGEFILVEGNGTNLEHSQNFVVVRRTNGPLPAQACTDTLFINQTQLLRVAVSVTGVNGFSITHLTDLTNDETSGVSLWWDANADGTFNTGDKFVKLLETPEFSTNGDTYSTVLTPDPQFITSWLSCSQSVSDTSFNFFVCVNTTEDMSYGDSFRVNANFYEPTEPNYTTGGNYFASASSGNIVCTSITNTTIKKLTTKGQTIDSNTTVRLAGINHFFGTAISGKSVYMTAVTVTIVAPEGSTFHPDTAFTPMDAASAANRGIQLVAANGNVIPCAIELITDDPEHGPWTYVLRPESSGGDSAVPQAQDDVNDHFIDVKLASTLPYGVSFYARMETDAIVYNTGKGSAAAAMVTDILGSTINSEYADLLDSSMVTPTSGLVVNKVGTGVASAYHDIKIGYNVNTNTYNLTWNGNKVDIDATQPGTYILGSGTNSITVTFDPAAFFLEDTLVTSESGRPDEAIAIGAKLTNVAGQGLKYYDANANGQYDLYEPIAFNGELIYGDGDVSLCVVDFTAASGLSFWDKDEDGVYAKGDSIFHDTDNKYTLPWMALLVDSDNYITAGQGGAASGVTAGTILLDAAEISPVFDEALGKGLYLYYIDMVADGRGYVYGEDIIVARTVTAADTMTAAALQKDTAQVYYDKIVFDPAYGKDGYAEVATGDLNCFQTMDYVKFRQGGNDPAAFEQGDSIFLSADDKFASPDFTWTIRVNKDRRIRWYSETAPAPYNQAMKSITAIAGLDIASSGATDVVLTSLTVRFVNVSNFTMDDLRSLTTDENSGVQLWRDLDGNGIFNPEIDKLVKLSSAPTLSSDATNYIVKFSPAADNEITNADVDGIYDFFVVVQPSITANNKQKVDNGDKFQIIINNNDVVLNETLNKSATLTSGTITIDSRFPALASDPVIADSDSDGYINTVTLKFDEALRPGMLDDTSIWKISDNTNGNPLTVTKATLSSDYKTVTLTLSDADIGTTTGKLSVIVIYGDSESALMDWAGNAVDFRIDATRPENADDYTNYAATSDTVAPQVVHTGLRLADAEYDEAIVVKAANFFFHDRNANGAWDEGEDIWVGESTYNSDVKTRVWNGGDNAWTTDLGCIGVELTNAYFCDANGDGEWNGFEFLWIDEKEVYEPEIEGDPETVVEGVYVEGNDTIVPLYRTEEIDVFDKDHDGHLDALRVYFSEDVNDSTMAGYVGTADSYAASKWSVTGGRTLTAWRLGFKNEDVTDNNLKNKIVKDVINNNCMYFTFDGDTANYDTGSTLTLTVASGETLKDINGNVLKTVTAATNDRAKPILLAAESDTRIDAAGVLAEGSKLTLTFSEPMAIFYTGDDIAEALKDLQINKNGAWINFDATLASAVEVSEDATKVVITMAESDSWSYKTVAIRLREDIDTYAEDTVLGDAAGNNVAVNANLAECPVTGIVYKDEPVIEIPVAYDAALNNVLRTDDLNVKIFFGSYGFFRSETTFANSYQVAEWKLTVTHSGTVMSEKTFTEETDITSIDQAADGFTVFTDREWLFEGGSKVADYVLALDLTAIDPDTEETFAVHTEVAFKAQAAICTDYTDIGGGKVVSAESGLVLNNVGDDVASGYYDVTLKRAAGAYTIEWNGQSAAIDDITKVTTVILGDGDNRIQVTLNPAAFSDELNEKIAADEDFDNVWTILIDQSRKINVYNSKAMNPYNVTAKAMSAVAGLDIANIGKENVTLESVTVHFVSVQDFDMSVLCDLGNDETSGVQLWRDANGNSVFDKDDAIVALSSAVAEDEGDGSYKVTLTPAVAEAIVGENVDGIYDYYIVVLPKEPETASNEGPQFKLVIKEGEIVMSIDNKHSELESKPYMIDSKAPEFSATVLDTDADGYIETVELMFDEELRRDSVEDISIWQLKDSSNGKDLTVVKAELDETCTTVILTLNGADFATTTSAASLMVAYNDDNALLDWAGNAVEFRTDDSLAEGDYANYINTDDTADPVVLHAGVATIEPKAVPAELFYHDRNGNDAYDEGEDVWTGAATFDGDVLNRVWNGGDNAWTTPAGYTGKALPADVEINAATRTEEIELYDNDGNGKLDAVKVSFSEAIDITTMAGYVEGENFVATAWTIDGREMTVDTANSGADFITFTFAEGEDYDSGKALVIAISDETLADAAGNVMVANDLLASDHAKPVLLDAESTVKLLQVETEDDCYMPEDGQIILTFSEDMAQFITSENVDDLLGEFEINRNGSAADAWTGLNGLVKSVAAEGNTIVLTMNETTGWGYRDVHIRVKAGIDALPDTVFGDIVGNNIAYTDTEFRVRNILNYYAPTIVEPVVDEFQRTDDLLVKMFFRSACDDNAFGITNWTFSVKNNGEQMGEAKEIAIDADSALALINGQFVFNAREWMNNNGLDVENYTLYLNFTWTDPDTGVATDVEYAVTFSAQANIINEYVDITDHAVITPINGMVIRKVGEGVTSGYYEFTVALNEAGELTIVWCGNTAVIDQAAAAEYTLGEGDDYVTVFIDPKKITAEDAEALINDPYCLTSLILVNKDRVVNAFSETAPAPYGDAKYYLNAVAAMDIACGNISGAKIATVKLLVKRADEAFTMADLRDLAADETSGLQLWLDNKNLDSIVEGVKVGNNRFDPFEDVRLELAGAPTVEGNEEDGWTVTFTLNPEQELKDFYLDETFDMFIVVSAKAGESNGHKFQVFAASDALTLAGTGTAPYIDSIETEVITIDAQFPQVAASSIADSDGDGYIETVTLTFDEPLRPMLADEAIWQLADSSNGKALTVEAVELSNDYKTVTLTLNGAELGTTTSPVSLITDYTAGIDTVLVDWAGNIVDFRIDATVTDGDYTNYKTTDDQAAPVVLNSAVSTTTDVAIDGDLYYHDRNANDAWDEGEDVWTGAATYDGSILNRVWNGGDGAWTTIAGYEGKALAEDVEVVKNLRAEEIAVLDTDNDGHIDAIDVYFSEPLDPATLETAAWTLAGYGALTAAADAENAAHVRFTFEAGSDYDTAATPTLTIDSSITDLAGNAVIAPQGLKLSDNAAPVLVYAKAEGGKIADDTMPEGVTVTLTFSEPVKQYLYTEGTVDDILSNFQIHRNNGEWEAITSELVSAVAVEDGKIVLTMVGGTTGWGMGASIDIRVKEDIAATADTVFGDEAGNNIAVNSVALYPYDDANVTFIHTLIEFQDAAILNPNETNKYLRTNGLPVQMLLNSACVGNAFQIKSWKFTVTSGEKVTEAEYDVDAANQTAVTSEAGLEVFTDTAWQVEDGIAPAEYTLAVSFTWIDPDDDNAETNSHDVEYTTTFTALAEKGVEPMTVADGDTYGENITEVQKNASSVWTNWVWGETNITNGNLLIKSYKSYYVDEEGNAVSATTETTDGGNGEYIAKMRLDNYLEVGKTYIAVVEAYDEDGDMIGRGVSDGVTVVEAFDDVESMEFTDGTELKVDNTDESYNVAVRTDSHDTLYAKWTQVSDSLTAKENMRYMYRVVSQFGSAQWSVDEGTMNQPRKDFGSAVLGDKLYAIGGFQDTVLNSVEVYDKSTRKWSEAASLNEARRNFACVKVSDTQIAAIGGIGEGDEPLTSIEIFDGSKWTKLSVELPEAYDTVKAVKVDDTYVWIVGAVWYKDETRQSVLKTEIRKFNIDTMSFDAEVIANPTITARYDDFQVVLQRRADGTNLVIADGLDAEYAICQKVDVVDVATGAVSTVELTDVRWGCAMIAVPSAADAAVDNVWFIGGMDYNVETGIFDYLQSVEQLDATGTIATLAGELNIGRAGASVYWNEDLNNVIVVGGFTSDHAWKNIPEIASNDGESWTQCPGTAMNVSRIGQHLEVVGTELNSKRMVLFGGTDQNNSYIAETESCIWIETLDASDWMVTEDDVTKVKVEGLDLKEGASYVFEVKAVDEQGYESAASRSAGIYISSSKISLELTPAPVANAAEGQVYELKVKAEDDGNTIDYYHYKVMCGGEVVDSSAESIEIATVTTLPAFVCADGEAETTYEITVWSAIDTQIVETTSVTVAKATFTVDSVEPLDVDNYTLGVNLNGLAAYEWQLDDGEVSETSTDAEFTVAGLAVGSHTVSLWGIDGNEIRQAEPTTITLFYKTPAIVGDVLTGVITADQDEFDGDVVTYTLTMSEAIVNDPVAANFTVENGVIESIEDKDGNKTTYTITVKPDGDGFVTITLNAGTLFTADKGIPNTASEAGKTLYHTKAVLAFTPEVVEATGEDFVAYVGDSINVNINFESEYVFLGGDLGIMFDSEVFELADVTDGEPDPTKMLAADYQLFNADKGKAGYVASWIKEDGKIVGIRLGGAKISDAAAAKNGTYATIEFKVLKEVTEGSAITLKALDNKDEYAGLVLQGFGLLQGDQLAAVEYGDVTVKTSLKRPILTLNAAQATVAEGAFDLTVTLSYALESDLAIDLKEDGAVINTLNIEAGKIFVTVTMDKADNLLTGDRSFTYEIACDDDAVIIDTATADVTVTDDDTALVMAAEAAEINEGGEMVITFTLADGITAAEDVTFDSPLVPTTDPDTFTSGIDFRMDAEPVIKAGENSGSITIKSYGDNEMKGDYDITVTLTGMTVGANVCSAFAEKSVTFTVKDADSKPGDLNNDSTVDYRDIMVFLSAMGASTADEDWADWAVYDFTNDGIIDYHDLMVMLSLMDEQTRGGTRAGENPVIEMWLETDSSSVKPGDVVIVKLMGRSLNGSGLMSFSCDVNFNAADLAYKGDFNYMNIVNTDHFDFILEDYGTIGGELAANGIHALHGQTTSSAKGRGGEPVVMATMEFIVKDTAVDFINIDLSELDANIVKAVASMGQLDITANALTLAVEGGADNVAPFTVAFEAHQQTRELNEAIVIGMKEGATYAAEADDMPAFDQTANIYDVRIVDARRDADLQADYRGLANRETWNVQITVNGGQNLTLSWANAELPEDFDFTIVKCKNFYGSYNSENATIDMRDATSMSFKPGVTYITIVANKKVSENTEADTYQFKLIPGWNLIGIPFALDEASQADFLSKVVVYAYDEAANNYIPAELTTLEAGVSYWVFADEAKSITVKAADGEALNGVALKAGWNWVAPLKGSELAMPAAARIVWFYTQDGYRQATEDADIVVGRGYWIYSDTDAVIWQTK